MTERKVTHAMFTIERTFPTTPQRVFNAFATREAKAKWFAGPPGWLETRNEMDFRVGGREVLVGGPKGGKQHTFDARYYEILPNERIVYAYEMYMNDTRISVSVATIQIRPDGNGTRLEITEQGAFLDGFDEPKMREQGTIQLIEALGRSLA